MRIILLQYGVRFHSQTHLRILNERTILFEEVTVLILILEPFQLLPILISSNALQTIG